MHYYFESSKGLALATFQRVQELISEEIRTSLISEGPASPKQIIRATVHGVIAATKSQQRLLRVAFVIESNALCDDELSMTLRTRKSSLIDLLSQQIKALDSSACPKAEDAHAKAVSLLAMADGLSSLSLSELISTEEARRLLDL